MENQRVEQTSKHRVPSFSLAIISLLLSLFYPNILNNFSEIVNSQNLGGSRSDNILPVIAAVLVMTLIFLIPVFSFWAIQRIDGEQKFKHPVVLRRILHFIFALSPIYVIVFLVMLGTDSIDWLKYAWYLLIGSGALLFIFFSGTGHKNYLVKKAKPLDKRWRLVHGYTALIVIIVFITPHLLNHILALWSVELHKEAMVLFRKLYRAVFVEPFILGLFLVLFVSGLRLIWHYTLKSSTFFRLLQTCSGIYLSMFLCAHSLAIFSTRMTGTETDWIFATSPKGVIYGPSMLFPYYTLATLFILLHASLGLRQLMIDKNWNTKAANKTFFGLTIFSFLATIWISMAITGIELHKTEPIKKNALDDYNPIAQFTGDGKLKVINKFESDLPGIQAGHYLRMIEVSLAPNFTEPLHTHPGTEILYVLEGKGQVRIDDMVLPLEKGTLVEVKEGQKKSLINTNREDTLRVAVFMVLKDNLPILKLCF